MSFNWSNYFYLAQELLGITPTNPPDLESRQRAAISRAYYAAYRTARTYLEDVEGFSIKFDYGNSHNQVIKEFSQYNDRLRSSIGENLFYLKQQRERADYEAVFNNGNIKLTTQTRFVMGRAAAVLGAIDTLYKKAQ